MKKIKSFLSVTAFAILVTLLVFWKIPVKGLIPFPGRLLVGRFFPFNTMSWEKYPAGVPYKEFINADVIRQLYPWRDLSIQLLKKGEMPWWNSYAFAGSPLLANIQSAPFYPLNILYWLTSHQNAWILGTMLQPILAIIWIWLFTREIGLSKPAAALSSISFAFSGYMIIWFELNTVGHAALWLPLILWGIERFKKTDKTIYLLAILFGQTASLLAGHVQTAVYVFIVSFVFFLFRVTRVQKKPMKKLLAFLSTLVLALMLTFPQLIPSLKFTPLTPRGTQPDAQIFKHFLLPPKHLATFFAHDYFGNPAVGNFWGTDYGEFMGYFGIVAIFFSAVAVIGLQKKEEVRFFSLLAAVALVFALPTPLAGLWRTFKIPILSTSAPSRTLFIVQFCGALLAGFGIDYWIKKAKLKPPSKTLLGFLGIYIFLWLLAFIGLLRGGQVETAQWQVTMRNLIPPTAVFISLGSITILAKSFTKIISKKVIIISSLTVLGTLTVVEYSYFANKFQTFSEPEFFFPQTPIYAFLSQNSQQEPFRFFGDYTASVTSNTWIPYEIYGVEGYDSLYIRRFGELLAASDTGKIPGSIPRSDANLVTNRDDTMRQRLQNLLGVKYILDKNDNPKSDWEPDPHRFPPERYQLIWQEGKFKVYENTQSLPRAFFVGNFKVVKDKQQIINTIFDPDFNLGKSVILEEDLDIKISSSEAGVEFIEYSPNKVILEVNTQTSQILFFSDTFYPDWVASIDGIETKIYRANYAFRAIIVPKGVHQVTFIYIPNFF